MLGARNFWAVMAENNRFVMFWWNTSLSPLGIRRSDRAAIDFVVAQIKSFRIDHGAALIALGEVSTEDLKEIMLGMNDPNLTLIDATGVRLRTKFDIALIYDKRRLHKLQGVSLVELYAGQALKLGEHVEFLSLDSGLPLSVIFSHWPSRIHLHELDPKRTNLGMELAKKFREICATSAEAGVVPYLILLGDYNDDPFSPSLADHLLASRDRDLSKGKAALLYNPTWRWLGESHFPGATDSASHGICGTYYWHSGSKTRWHTFDQIIVSPSFLVEGAMELDESLGSIFVTPVLREMVLSRKSKIDHLPVVSVINMKRIQ